MPKIDVLTTSGKKTTPLSISGDIFAAPIRPQLMSQAVRVYLSNQRQAPAKTKSRGQIKVTHKKVWRQKGTGKARHGSRNAPIFVGGAKAHGPTGQQNYHLKLSKKMKRASLFSALTQRFQDKDIIALTGLDKLKPKTKDFNIVFNKVLNNPKKALLILDQPSESINRGTRNLSHISATISHSLNTYQVLNARKLIFTKNSLKALENHFLKSTKSTKSKN